MNLPSLDRVAFVFSLTLFSLLYGIVAQAFGWFPSSLLRQAWNQAEAVSPLDTNWLTGDDEPLWLTTREYDRSGVRVVDGDLVQPGLTLFTSAWGSSRGWELGLRLVDRTGQVAHEWRLDPKELFANAPEARTKRDPKTTNLHGSHLFPNGDVLVNVNYVGVVRLDACSRLVWKLPMGNHHSIARVHDGSFWISGGIWDTSADSLSNLKNLPGLPEQVYRDRLIHVSQQGELLEEIDLLDVLYLNGLQRYIPKGSLFEPSVKPADITHLNDVEPLSPSMAEEYPLFEGGDLVVSVHHLDLVFVLDPESLRVKWYTSDPFIQQHDPDYIGGGWIGVFDNNRDGTERGTMLGGSRIVAVQPHTDSVKILFPTEHSDPFYTHVQGKWQQLANGNLLLTETESGRVVEVTPDGRTVWEWIADPYDGESIAELTEGTRYDLGWEEVAAWPCSPGNHTDNPKGAVNES